jgi:hypothetical protein
MKSRGVKQPRLYTDRLRKVIGYPPTHRQLLDYTKDDPHYKDAYYKLRGGTEDQKSFIRKKLIRMWKRRMLKRRGL